MEWEPISEVKLWDDINNAFDRMSLEQRSVWEIIKIHPENGSKSLGAMKVKVFGWSP